MSDLSRLLAIFINSFMAPLFLMFGLHGFGLHPGYWSCLLLTMTVGAEFGALFWALPTYLGKKGSS